MEEYSLDDRVKMVGILLEDPLFRELHESMSGSKLYETYIKRSPEDLDAQRIRIANQQFIYELHLELQRKRGIVSHYKTTDDSHHQITDADSQPLYVKGSDVPVGVISRWDGSQDLSRLVRFHN